MYDLYMIVDLQAGSRFSISHLARNIWNGSNLYIGFALKNNKDSNSNVADRTGTVALQSLVVVD
jgi:hypothetical protein